MHNAPAPKNQLTRADIPTEEEITSLTKPQVLFAGLMMALDDTLKAVSLNNVRTYMGLKSIKRMAQNNRRDRK